MTQSPENRKTRIKTLQKETPAAARMRLAADPHRPRYHFVPPANWMNDPNGLIHWRGQYHLFYQYNPHAPIWGTIYWGHAASADLLHWHDQPVALSPTPGGSDQDGCWTGCAVDDDGTPTLIYTGRRGERESVCLATSQDGLLTWAQEAHNPVITAPPPGLSTTGFRDPYVWREGETWYMVIGSGIAGQGGTALLYRSRDLRHWEYLGPLFVGDAAEHGAMWECPNFFSLGDRHVLIVSKFQSSVVLYFVGTYANHKFTPEREGIVDYGAHFFAPQVMIDQQGRRLIFGWAWEGCSEAVQRAAGWAGVQSLPRVLSLAPDHTLLTHPAPELTTLREAYTCIENIALTPSADVPLPVQGDSLEIVAEFQVGLATCGLKLRCTPDHSQETVLGYEGSTGCLFVNRERASRDPEAQGGVHRAPLSLSAGETLKLHLFLDRSMLELFANRRRCLTSRIYPIRPDDSLDIKLFASGGGARLKSLEAWQLKSIWPESTWPGKDR